MLCKLSVKASWSSIRIAILFFALTVGVVLIWMPAHYFYYFHKFKYSFPDEGQPFVVNVDPVVPIPLVMKRIITAAFSERRVEFTNEKEPNLIVHISSHAQCNRSSLKPAPYIILHGDPMRSSNMLKYRKYGLPLLEFLSNPPKHPSQIYLPFIVWGGTVVKNRKYINVNRPRHIAYIAANCVTEREKLFALLKGKIGRGVDALGRCSNSNRTFFASLKKKIWPKTYLNENYYPDNTFKIPGRSEGSRWVALPEFYSHYTFGFAMENSQMPGYITEKITNVFKGGAIPIYWGDTKIVEEYFNPNAFIDVGKFNSLEEAANYIAELIKDSNKIKAMQQEPIFKNNVMPDILKMNLEDETGPNPLIEEMAKTLRARYFEFLSANA